jgi:PTH1 family peptidyl-tRNA hydrolase
MLLIVGLGNPGAEYAYTRHNLGFLFADYFANREHFSVFRTKFSSLCSEAKIAERKVVIQKPQTYMNLSGKAVGQIVTFYKLKAEQVVVFHDDIDLPQFEIRVKNGGGNGGHNGIRSIDEAIGREYWRIRVGIGRPALKEQVASYVLARFSDLEIRELSDEVFPTLAASFTERFFNN